jgi:hypothetical protein
MTISEKTQASASDVAVKLFAFMRQSDIKCIFARDDNELFNFTFDVRDMTTDGTPFGLAFKLNPSIIEGVEDTPEAIEQFCYNMALKVGVTMLEDKLTRNLQCVTKSKIIVPK